MPRLRGPLGFLAAAALAISGIVLLAKLGLPEGIAVILWANVMAIALELSIFHYGRVGAGAPGRNALATVVLPMIAALGITAALAGGGLGRAAAVFAVMHGLLIGWVVMMTAANSAIPVRRRSQPAPRPKHHRQGR